ncbi:hypothetical protein PSH79_02715 [Pseudomonas sp. FP2196]|uniref:hypothetical protein n=1 Tax=Pseudomonas sp. FP2196 TaxID=2954086 RepID=UPI0027369B23|nr:hypothetical protein [Pseudomonas sp. FP2196]WLH36219.1 hypothetical protein PSH79_02715 [Pseudomonas sp. FP2196]
MPVKPPTRSTVTVDVHTHPNRTPDVDTSFRDSSSRVDIDAPISHSDGHTRRPGRTTDDVDLDAILPAPKLTIRETIQTTTTVELPTPTNLPLEYFRLAMPATLPDVDADGFRTHKGRRYVELAGGGVALIETDPDSGLHRARLPSELNATGPVLLRDTDSGFWHTLEHFQPVTRPLTDSRLKIFRTDLDFGAVEPGSDGVFAHDGKRYVVIGNHAYQVMHDLDASSPAHKVWRIVNPKDPVATDSMNILRTSRSGETLAIARDERNNWVAIVVGLAGGMRRNESAQVTKALLLQRYEPIANAHALLNQSNNQYAALWNETRLQPEGSAQKTVALIKIEVHALKHIKMQTDFVQSLIDNKDWLIHLKAGGRYKEELHTFQMERVDYFNKVMAIMDFRVMPTVTGNTVENCKKTIAHLNKKLKLLDDRQAVIEQIKKASPGDAFELTEISRNVPGADQINYNKLALFLRLLSDNPESPPETGMQSMRAIQMFIENFKNDRIQDNPIALLLAVDQIRDEKGRFESQLNTASPDKAEYIKEIIALVDPFEKRIDKKLSDIYDTFGHDTELPNLDQDIDFDFVPQQPVNADAELPPAPKKMFRTRQHGTDRILMGEKEIAPDGNVTLKVADLFSPNAAPQHYEKRQGAWRPVRPLVSGIPRSQLIDDANQLLAGVGARLAEAKVKEAQKTNPTEILEFLDKQADLLHDQARLLKNHETAAEDTETLELIARLQSAGESLNAVGKNVLLRMYKNPDVLDILRLNYLLDHSELTVTRTVERKLLGKGNEKYYLDVYQINDRSGDAALWEAHFKYDRRDSTALNFKNVGGAHLKTLEQGGRGIEAQRRDAQAGLPHVAIWRESFDRKTAAKIFSLVA